ncbi:hypothetical protein [Jatrophihabitans sp.]|uniref:hypothetical protein n=1 Tax=Jatrophihabitans sp. TaxID=1932789 RepID=UPI002C8A375D|nr:hypothetical protein [Jatrophihabitans sp.]
MASRRKRNRLTVPLVSLATVAAFLVGMQDAQAASQVSLSGTGAPITGDAPASGAGDVTQAEFVGETDDEADVDEFPGMINDRSLSDGTGHGVSVASGKKAKSTPEFTTGFEGLNLYQQRYARGGNQFTVEPPDQALCVGNGYVLEAVNDVLNIFNSAGQSVLPDNTATNVVSGFPRNVNHAVDLNSFYGYAPAINRTTGVRAQNITDPTCIFDAATQRFFLLVLTLESTPGGTLTQVNHLDLAVSQTANPTGSWNIYKIDVTNDGTNAGGVNPGPYLGDYPHIGADANGVYLTTNAYPWNSNGFAGAQIYALSKAQLAAGSANVNVVHIDTFGKVNVPSEAGATQPGFTVWPAHSPGSSSYDANAGGTEYLLSSNAADEATHPITGTGGNYVSSQIVTWALTNTSSLNTATPDLHLSTKELSSNTYAIPPKQRQQGAGTPPGIDTPQGHCINDTTTSTIAGVGCWRLLVGAEPAHNEVISRPDSNDTRMQQVMYANGKIWGALDTALNPGGTAQRAGIAWFQVKPDTSSGTLAAKMALQGYLGAAGADFTYPTIGVTASGRGAMGFTYSGDSAFPSAAYAPIDALVGVGAWAVLPGGAGQAADDGFTSYKAQVGGNPPRTRWGDYGAAAVDGNHVWLASEYIAHSCDYQTWGGPFFAGGSGDNLLGTCAGASHGAGSRTALGNWSTRISELTL